MGTNELKFSEDGKLYLRKSMVETHSFCPYKFRKEWLEGVGVVENYYMSVGTRFHEFAYWFFDVCEAYDTQDWKYLIPKSFTAEEKSMAAWWIEAEIGRHNYDPDNFMPYQREIKLDDHQLCISGTLDRMDWVSRDDNTLAIVEYKTGFGYNEESIARQLSYYKLIWDNTIKSGDVIYIRYINPRIHKYRDVPYKPRMTDDVLLSISKVRKAIKDDVFPRRCSERKLIMCQLCTTDECGIYD